MCPVAKIRRFLFSFFPHSSHWVVLSKRKRRRPWCSVLLASLCASLTAHLPADDCRYQIRARHAMPVVPLCYYTSCMFVFDTCVGLLQDCAVSLADGWGKGSTYLSGSTENLEWRHPTHLHRDPQWEGWHSHRLHKVGEKKPSSKHD